MKYTATDNLVDCYAEMLGYYEGMGDMHCAITLMDEHGDDMTPQQRRALKAFIEFWDALDTLERTHVNFIEEL